MSWLERIYCYIWYHLEIPFTWGNKHIRRPFTYILRDTMLCYPYLFWPFTAGWFAIMWWIGSVNYTLGWAFTGLSGFVLGHLIWGTQPKLGEQETPEFIEEEH